MNRYDDQYASAICWAGATLSLLGCLISIYRRFYPF